MSDNRQQTRPPMTIATAYALAYAEAVKRTNENRAASLPVKAPEASLNPMKKERGSEQAKRHHT